MIGLHYLPFAKGLASRFIRRFPRIDFDDLQSAANEGLLQAIETFDLTRALKFETFAAYRIQGAILDYVRSVDHLGRMLRRKARRTEATRHRLFQQLQREPSEQIIREALDDPADYFESRTPESIYRILQSSDDHELTRCHTLTDPTAEDPADHHRRLEFFCIAARGLDEFERYLLCNYYLHGRSMKAIGKSMGLSESRISQLHDEMMERLKTRRSELYDAFQRISA